MRRVAILIPGSRTSAFFSQIAAISAALEALPWRRWVPSVHAYLGDPSGSDENGEWERFAPFLRDVHITNVSAQAFMLKGNWAQVDATLELAPSDADVLMSLDADTLPVAGFEDVLDRVADEDLIAGVTAHYPPPAGAIPYDDWSRTADLVIDKLLTFDHTYSLAEPDDPDEDRVAPFYVNGGVVFYGRSCFDTFVPVYLKLRSRLSKHVAIEDYTGQIASTLAVTEAGLNAWALPMRYNFPNDSSAQRLHPQEAENVVIYHYLRTDRLDRHGVFVTSDAFDRFLALPLDGPDLGFQTAVRRVFDSRYPFT